MPNLNLGSTLEIKGLLSNIIQLSIFSDRLFKRPIAYHYSFKIVEIHLIIINIK